MHRPLVDTMTGFITEKHFDQVEIDFPGIRALYGTCEEKPGTFLELVALYLRSALPAKSEAATSGGRLSMPSSPRWARTSTRMRML